MIEIIEGDIFETDCRVIAHQVNCIGVMGSGLAREIKNRWSDVFFKYLESIKTMDHNCLGGCLIVDVDSGKSIANLFGQYYYKGYFNDVDDYFRQSPERRPGVNENGELRFTNYEALFSSLSLLREKMLKYEVDSVSFPYKLGSDRGGGNWEIVKTMIEEIFKNTNIRVEIRKKGN